MKTNDNTSFSIPSHVKEVDIFRVGHLIEVHATDFSWKSNAVCSVMELKTYAKGRLGFRQTTPNKWRWSR